MSSFDSASETPAITPRQTFRGHTERVAGVVHLHAGRQIITCSPDNSLRLWDLESGTQIGENWRDEEGESGVWSSGVWSMALSPNGKTIASGCNGGKVKLWDVKTRKVIAEWSGHTHVVGALCWSGDGKRVLSGSWDGEAKVRDVESSQTVLTIKTGHYWVWAVIYYLRGIWPDLDTLGGPLLIWEMTDSGSTPSPCLRMTDFFMHQIIKQCMYGILTPTFQSDHSSSTKIT